MAHALTGLVGSMPRVWWAWVVWTLANGVWIIAERLGCRTCVMRGVRLEFPTRVEFNYAVAVLLLVALAP